MIFLQKIGFSVSAGAFGLDAMLLWLGLGLLLLAGDLTIVRHRLVLLIILLNAIVLSLLLSGLVPKLSALLIVLVMFAGFVFRLRLPEALLNRCLDGFQRTMAIIAACVLAQQVLQYTVGNRFWPNLDRLIPPALLYPGFAYIHPYSWRSPLLEPNGVFFLEPSGLSYYLAISLVLEAVRFRRLRLLALFLVATLACRAETGPVVLLITAPLWAARMGRRLFVPIALVGVPLMIVALHAGWLSSLTGRAGELGNSQSSGYARVVVPFETIRTTIADPDFLLTGLGPGASPRGANLVAWPFSKLLVEYGLVTAVLFHLYLLVCVLDGPPSRVLGLVMLLPYLFFGGGFVSHASVMPLLLLGSLLGAADPRDEAASSRARITPMRSGRALSAPAAPARSASARAPDPQPPASSSPTRRAGRLAT